MKIEHFAINVSNPVDMADWYCKNLGMKIVRQQNEHPNTAFLSDESGMVMLEIYNNPSDQVPDYYSMDPLILHLAFVSDNPGADKARLVKEGAKEVSDDELPDGSHLIMLRDPWGFCIQLCKRAVPMLREK